MFKLVHLDLTIQGLPYANLLESGLLTFFQPNSTLVLTVQNLLRESLALMNIVPPKYSLKFHTLTQSLYILFPPTDTVLVLNATLLTPEI